MDRATVWTLGIAGVLILVVGGGYLYDDEEKKRCVAAGGTWDGLLKGCVCPSGQVMSNGHCCPQGTTWDGSQCKAGGGSGSTLQQNCIGSGGTWANNACTCPPGYTLDSTGRCVVTSPSPTPTPTPGPVTSKPGRPGTPYKVTESVTGIGYNANLTINWAAASNAASYSVIDPDNGRTLASGLISGPYTALNLYAGATIHLAVVAHNSAGSTQGGIAEFTLPCPAGYYSTGQGCQTNRAAQNISAWDSTRYSTGLGPGCFTAAWNGVPAGTTEVQIWHIDPSTGEGTMALATGISPAATYQSVCRLYPGAVEHWNIRAYANGNLVGYSNVVSSTTTS